MSALRPSILEVGQPLASPAFRRRGRLYLIAVLVIVSLNMAAVWIDAESSSYVPCVENCAETFHVLKYVRNFHVYGTKYGFLELQETSYGLPQTISPGATKSHKPLVYTHNPNLPGLLFVLLEVAGVHSLAGKQVLTLVAHGLGLLYGFFAARQLTRSALVALVLCGLFATEYEMVFGFALNALRAWHWLALFGLIFHVARAVSVDRLGAHLVAVGVFATIAMGMGYDFFAISACVSTTVALLFGLGVPGQRVRLTTYAALVAAFLFPIAARQVQVLSVMGSEYWRTDLFYSILTKASFLRGLVEQPPITEIEAYYASVGVYRPPTSSRALSETLSLSFEFLRYVTLPAFGILALAVCAGMSVVFLLRPLRTRPIDPGREPAGSAIKAVFCLAAGTLLGIAVFADHNVVIFIKHKVPLIAAPILLAKAAVIGLLFDASAAAASRSRRIVLACLGSLLVADHLAVQYSNRAAITPYRHTWIDEVRARPDATYGISWDPTAVSVFANTMARSVSARDELAIAQLAADYKGTPAAPRIDSPLLADLPDYWLYFPTDAMSPFDSFSPDCRLDYLSTAVADILWPAHPVIQPGSWVRPVPAAPGGYVVFGGTIAQLSFRNAQLVQINPTASNGELTTNCRRRTLSGWIQTSDRQGDGEYVMSLGPRNRGYSQLRADLTYRLAANAPPPDFEHPALLLQLPRPSVDEMRGRLASVPVAKAGPTWVLFDLRGLRQRHARLNDLVP